MGVKGEVIGEDDSRPFFYKAKIAVYINVTCVDLLSPITVIELQVTNHWN